jgi:hypothetical protein
MPADDTGSIEGRSSLIPNRILPNSHEHLAEYLLRGAATYHHGKVLSSA